MYAPAALAAPLAGETTCGVSLTRSTKSRLSVGMRRSNVSETTLLTPCRVGLKSPERATLTASASSSTAWTESRASTRVVAESRT